MTFVVSRFQYGTVVLAGIIDIKRGDPSETKPEGYVDCITYEVVTDLDNIGKGGNAGGLVMLKKPCDDHDPKELIDMVIDDIDGDHNGLITLIRRAL